MSIMKSIRHRKFRLKDDSGWTLLEATISVVIIALVFLGFTVSLISFREWMDRSWGIRVLDQYANDVMSYIAERMEVASDITENPPLNGLGSFTITVQNVDVYSWTSNPPTTYTFAAHPSDGVLLGVDNVPNTEFYTYLTKGQETFPPTEWKGSHDFRVVDFHFERNSSTTLPETFKDGMAEVFLKLEYIRERQSPDSKTMDEATLLKEYRVGQFLLNTTVTTD